MQAEKEASMDAESWVDRRVHGCVNYTVLESSKRAISGGKFLSEADGYSATARTHPGTGVRGELR